jgi:hypothetical protein
MSDNDRNPRGGRSLEDWDTWIDKAIRDAQQRGDFDNLPGAGKPLAIDDNPFAGEMGTAFGILKNAGMAPPWIELDKEVRAGEAELRQLRERQARRFRAEVDRLRARIAEADDVQQRPVAQRRWPFGRARPTEGRIAAFNQSAWSRLEAERQRARQAYLEQAARLDAKIAECNALLPAALSWRQRPRPTSEQAAAAFDAACPPVTSEAWSSRDEERRSSNTSPRD